MPLWTQTNWLCSSERCGWELTAFGSPWVAQRVCAIPTWTVNSASQSTLFNAEKLHFLFGRTRNLKSTFYSLFEFFDFAFLSHDDASSFRFRRGILIYFQFITIECNTGWIVTTIFQAMKTVDKNIRDKSTITFDQIIQISENPFEFTKNNSECSIENRASYHTCLLSLNNKRNLKEKEEEERKTSLYGTSWRRVIRK